MVEEGNAAKVLWKASRVSASQHRVESMQCLLEACFTQCDACGGVGNGGGVWGYHSVNCTEWAVNGTAETVNTSEHFMATLQCNNACTLCVM